jgi:hypothetical protein
VTTSPQTSPTPTPRAQQWGMAELQAEVDNLLANLPADEISPVLHLRDISFTEYIYIGRLLGSPPGDSRSVNCPFALQIDACTFLQGFSATNVSFTQSVFFDDSTEFFGITSFKNATFLGENTSFDGAKFSGENTSFEKAKFFGYHTFFSRAIFSSKKTSFELSRFSVENHTYFENTKFLGRETFFNCATFMETISFNSATFSGALISFDNTTFSGEHTSFDSATFSGEYISFKETKFLREDSPYGSNASFSKAKFEGGVTSFHEITAQHCSINFEYLSFANEGRLEFFDCFFEGQQALINFIDISFDSKERIFLDNSVLNKKAEQTRYDFQNCRFRPNTVVVSQMDTEELRIEGGNGLAGFKFQHCLWPRKKPEGKLGFGLQFQHAPDDFPVASHLPMNITLTIPRNESDLNPSTYTMSDNADLGFNKFFDARRKLYERLKKEAQDGGDTQTASDFYFWQQWYRYQSLRWFSPEFLDKSISQFYLATSAFGLSVMRPLIRLLFWVFGVFAGSYALLLSWLRDQFDISKGLPSMYVSGLTLAISHGNPLEALNLKALLQPALTTDELDVLSPWLSVVFALLFFLQNTMQLYFLFQISAAIRNKVKR